MVPTVFLQVEGIGVGRQGEARLQGGGRTGGCIVEEELKVAGWLGVGAELILS